MSVSHQGTVLYVDDDAANRKTFALVFREAGFEVKEAATGSEALKLAAEKPDLIVLDVNLPDITGFEVCRHIKAHPATTAIPVMHMSGVYVTPGDRTAALEEGADVYLTKPVEPRELLAQARALLRVHQAEERAAATARQWQSTFAAINDGVCLLDEQGRVVRCNVAAERILQRPAAEIIGRQIDQLLPAVRESSVLQRMFETRGRETAELTVGLRWLQTIADPMLDKAGAVLGAVFILSDVTERKRLEEQLRQSQKMEALGRLASGIAHDFNNLLTAVTGNASLLLAGRPPSDPDRELLVVIEQAAWRAAELTQKLLGFARRSAPVLRTTDLRLCLDEVAAILRRTIDPRLTLHVSSTADLWPVQADPGQMNQVLMNLCLNARDAMPTGGRILLEAENVVLAEGQSLSTGARPGEFIRLRVRDTGPGIPPDVLPHLFEPFFTTKEAGKGTGLGLATVYGIVSQHHGWVECSSTEHAAARTDARPSGRPASGGPHGVRNDPVGQGACFDVYLPRSAEAVSPLPAAAAPAAPGGTETILLADDDPLVRNLSREMLRRCGYQVLLAEDGEQVAELYSREQQRIDLVVLNRKMPRLSWRETLARLLQINPQVRVLLTSGDTTESIEPGLKGVLGFLAKPYRGEDLARAVRTALDEKPGEEPPPRPPEPPTGPAPSAPPGAEATPTAEQEAHPAAGEEHRSNLTKAEAEDLLDLLEACGFQRQVRFPEGQSGFTVQWRQEAPAETSPTQCRRRYRSPCPDCGSTSPPSVVQERPVLSWVLMACGVLIWPLLILGLGQTRDVWRCWDCGRVLGRGRLRWRG
jgi:two-component system cell cycle sensor histidine kinase/response regulator CckA